MSGPDGKNLTASTGKNPHEITKVKTKNVMSGCLLTADIKSLLSPARERGDCSRCHDLTFRPPARLPMKPEVQLTREGSSAAVLLCDTRKGYSTEGWKSVNGEVRRTPNF
jgi:hypothetical protein